MSGIKDVAKKAGVSISTVSNVLNKSKYVSPDLVMRVEKAVEELSYEANPIARSMKNRTEHEKVFGIQIDSLCDLVCFGVFPAVIGYHYNSVYPLRLIASIMIVLGAVIRLGYFNVMEEERQRNTTENRKEYKVMNDRYNDVQLEDILNERLQMYISHMEQKGVQIMDCRVNIDTTDDRGSCTGELEVLLPVTN